MYKEERSYCNGRLRFFKKKIIPQSKKNKQSNYQAALKDRFLTIKNIRHDSNNCRYNYRCTKYDRYNLYPFRLFHIKYFANNQYQ